MLQSVLVGEMGWPLVEVTARGRDPVCRTPRAGEWSMTHPSGGRSQSVGLDREGSTLAFAAMVRLVRVVGEMSVDRLGFGQDLLGEQHAV